MAVGYVATGGQVAYHAAPRPSVSWPHQIGVLPRQADCFQDRTAAEHLEQAVADGGTAVLCQVLAGMGGVGKTQLAARHARTLWQDEQLDLLVWITATTRAAVISGYAQAAADVLDADPTDPGQAARVFLAWLESKSSIAPRRWLVVLDDVPQPATLAGLWPPDTACGRTLITTRNRDAAFTAPGRRRIDIDLFTPDEATGYLTEKLAVYQRRDVPTQIRSLAEDLGYLPLALAQAVPYMVNKHLDCAAYRQRLADHARTLPTVLADASGLPDEQLHTVAAAWSLSIGLADQLPPVGVAGPMLRLAAMLDPNGIPTPVLTSPPALAHLTAHRDPPAQPGVSDQEPEPDGDSERDVSAEDAGDALWNLHQLSLVDYTPAVTHKAVRVHQLIQRATRESLPSSETSRLALIAADALTATWSPIRVSPTPLGEALRSNTAALASHAEDALYRHEAHPVLYLAGREDGPGAADHFHHMAEAAMHYLGPEHPDTLNSRYLLACCQSFGDSASARTAKQELLIDCLRALGPGDPLSLRIRGDLLQRGPGAEYPPGAATAMQDLLTDYLRLLGPDHPDTLDARFHLVTCLGWTGEPAEALTAAKDLLAEHLRVLGPDDLDTLDARSYLAHCLHAAGDLTGALTVAEDLLTEQTRLLGPDNWETADTRSLLAEWQREARENSLIDVVCNRCPDNTQAERE